MDKKEKEVKQQKKEKVKKTETKEKQNKVNLDNKKKLIILISSIVLITIIGITIFLVLRNNDEYKLADVEPTISTLEDGTYYIFGSPNNQSFEVEAKEDFAYKVVDEESNEVEVLTTKKDNKVLINAPEELYEDGKTYTLTITNGKFIDEELKEASVVSFSIVRKSKQSSELNKNVKSISSETNKVSESDDKITLTSEETYKTGDIILIDNKKVYKIEKAEDGVYQLSIPTIQEVYKEFDYYGSTYLNLSEFEENEEVEEYLVAYAEENIIDKIIPKVNAASKVEVDYKWDKKVNGLVATIHAETDPGDKIFNKSFLKHHKLSFDYEVVIKIKVNYDIFFDKYDVNFTLEVSNTPSFTIKTESEILDKIKEGLKVYTAGENALALLQSDYKTVEKDTKNLKQTVGKVVAPTPVPGLDIIVDIGLIMEADLKANMNATLTNANTITIGLSNKKGLYGNLKYKNTINASAFGEASMRLGSQVDLGASLLGIVELYGGVKGGIYGKATLDMKSEVSDDKVSANLLATTKAGLFSTIIVEAKVLGMEQTAIIYDGELELYNYELPLSSESENTKPVVKEEATPKPETNSDNSSNNSNQPTTYYNVNIYGYYVDPKEDATILNYHARKTKFIKTIKVQSGKSLANHLKESINNCPGFDFLCEDPNDTLSMYNYGPGYYYNSGVLSEIEKDNNSQITFWNCYNAAETHDERVSCPQHEYDFSEHITQYEYDLDKVINSNLDLLFYRGIFEEYY